MTKIYNKYPNSYVESHSVFPEYAQISEKLTQAALLEFYKICKIPRPSGYMGKIQSYLLSWGQQYGYKTYSDNNGTIVIETPSTVEEESPTVILQSHMDMVSVGNRTLKDFNPQTSEISPVFHEDTGIIDTQRRTSLGADDGIGMACALAIAAMKDIKHGPLRLVFTRDEETGFQGAYNMDKSLLDTEYLINLDSIAVGLLVSSAAGAFKFEISNECTLEDPSNDEISVQINISGLAGGHSGEEIDNNLASTTKLLTKLFQDLKEKEFSFKINSIDAGTFMNAIATDAVAIINVPQNDYLKIKNAAGDLINKELKKTADANNAKYSIEKLDDVKPTISKDDTYQLAYVLGNIPNGVIERFKDNKKPLTSSNLGIITLKNGKFYCESLLRSASQNTLKTAEEQLKILAKNCKMKFDVAPRIPALEKEPNNKLINMFLDAYQKTCGFSGELIDIHSGLELGCLKALNPKIVACCVGCDIEGEHTINEKLYTKTMPQYFASLLYVLQKLATTSDF